MTTLKNYSPRPPVKVAWFLKGKDHKKHMSSNSNNQNAERMKPFMSRIFGLKAREASEESVMPEVRQYSIVPIRDRVSIGESIQIFFVASRKGYSLLLENSTVDLWMDGLPLQTGVPSLMQETRSRICSCPLTSEDADEHLVRITVISPEGTRTVETLSFTLDRTLVRRPDTIWIPDVVSVDIGETVRIPIRYSPADYDCEHVQYRLRDTGLCSVTTELNTVSVTGLKSGSTTLQINPEGIGNPSAIARIHIREECILKIMATYDRRGDATGFSLIMHSEEQFTFSLRVKVRYRLGGTTTTEIVNEDHTEFVSNTLSPIHGLDKTLRNLHRYRIKSLSMDFNHLDYDRMRKNVEVVRSFETGEQWWASIPSETD